MPTFTWETIRGEASGAGDTGAWLVGPAEPAGRLWGSQAGKPGPQAGPFPRPGTPRLWGSQAGPSSLQGPGGGGLRAASTGRLAGAGRPPGAQELPGTGGPASTDWLPEISGLCCAGEGAVELWLDRAADLRLCGGAPWP